MAGKVRLNVSVDAETVESLRAMACTFGFVSRVGKYAGTGNISQMLDALGAGLLGVYDVRHGDHLKMTVSSVMPRDEAEFLALLDKIRARLVAEMAERQLQRPLDLGPDVGMRTTEDDV